MYLELKKKLFSMKITNTVSFVPVSERKTKEKWINKQIDSVCANIEISITGNNESRFLTQMFAISKKQKGEKKYRYYC